LQKTGELAGNINRAALQAGTSVVPQRSWATSDGSFVNETVACFWGSGKGVNARQRVPLPA